MNPLRRVVAGLNAEGRSCISIDDQPGMVIWATHEAPADNSGNADAGAAAPVFPTEGTLFMYSDFPPGMTSPLHATDTIDYVVILSGECAFITETGETKLKAGDVVIDRGILHAWRNDGSEPCRLLSVLCAAKPVGKGATMKGSMLG